MLCTLNSCARFDGTQRENRAQMSLHFILQTVENESSHSEKYLLEPRKPHGLTLEPAATGNEENQPKAHAHHSEQENTSLTSHNISSEDYVYDETDKARHHRWDHQHMRWEIQIVRENGDLIWVAERILHWRAAKMLFAYWDRIGGHPPNPEDGRLWEVYAAREFHKQSSRVLVEWTGYEKNTWEPLNAVKKVLVVKEYLQALDEKKKKQTL